MPALLIVVGLGVTLVALTAGRSAAGPISTELSFDVGDPSGCTEISVNDTIVVELKIADVSALMAWEATVTHDRSITEITAREVRILSVINPPFKVLEDLPDANGRHLLAAGGNSQTSESGSGLLAEITFKGVGAGVSTIDIPQNDFDSNGTTDEGAILTMNGGGEIGDIRDIVDAADRPGTELRQARQPVDLGRIPDLVRDQHVLDAAAGEDLGLRDLLAADAATAA